jgi:hypothetical protein
MTRFFIPTLFRSTLVTGEGNGIPNLLSVKRYRSRHSIRRQRTRNRSAKRERRHSASLTVEGHPTRLGTARHSTADLLGTPFEDSLDCQSLATRKRLAQGYLIRLVDNETNIASGESVDKPFESSSVDQRNSPCIHRNLVQNGSQASSRAKMGTTAAKTRTQSESRLI